MDAADADQFGRLGRPGRGFIKLEDTVAVTDDGHEVYGEGARGWNRAGTAT